MVGCFHEARGRTSRDPAATASDNIGMDILLNGESRSVTEPCRVSDLLLAEGLGERRVAVEINGAIVPRSAHADHVLQAGDQVEIVHALGGG